MNKPQFHEKHEWITDVDQVLAEGEVIEVHCNYIDCPAKSNLKINVLMTEEIKDDVCGECGKPYNSEYHMSDECVNPNEDRE